MTIRITVAIVAGLGLNAAVASGAAFAGQTEISDEFCNAMQNSIMSNLVPAVTKIHPTWDDFLESKASVDPLRNEQFTTLGPNGEPRMVSCKFKAADHIREVYGDNAAVEEPRTCEALNRENVAAVIAAFTPEEAERRVLSDDEIMFEEDTTVFMGVKWVEPYTYAWRGESGALHIQSKRLQVDWTNLLFKMTPEAFRGALYCHLIAPEYAKALILGDADVPPPSDG